MERCSALPCCALSKEEGADLSPALHFHGQRHTYASLSVAAGIPADKLSRRMGHTQIGTTLGIYVHLFPEDDAADDMAALGAMARKASRVGVNKRRTYTAKRT